MEINTILTAIKDIFNGTNLPEITNIQTNRAQETPSTYPVMYIYPLDLTAKYDTAATTLSEYTMAITIYYQIDERDKAESKTTQDTLHTAVDKVRKIINAAPNIGGACTVIQPPSGRFRVTATPGLTYACDLTFKIRKIETFV